MEEMVRDIRVEFDTILSQIGWMDDKTRKRAKVTDSQYFPKSFCKYKISRNIFAFDQYQKKTIFS
jgi:hypothetical protein